MVSGEGKMQDREWGCGADSELYLECVEHKVSTTQVKLFKIVKNNLKPCPTTQGL